MTKDNLKSQFDEIVKKVTNAEVNKDPGMADKLKLYALYKQATIGDIEGECPTDFTGKMKHQAWSKLKGMKKEDAMKKYIDYFL